jgi:hypothetical protein
MPQLSALPGSAQWGSVILGGSVVTGGGLVFIAAAMDNFLRAFDIETGRELAKWELPAGGQGDADDVPVTKGREPIRGDLRRRPRQDGNEDRRLRRRVRLTVAGL